MRRSRLRRPVAAPERFGGWLEYHTPWSEDRDVSHLFRGLVSTDEAHGALAEAELEWLRLVDNGVIRVGSNGGEEIACTATT